MNIINQSRELTKMELYKLTEGKKTISVKDAVGLTFRVDAWCEYEDQNERGDKSHVLSILATDTLDGDNPATAHDVFMAMQEIPYILKTEHTPESKLLTIEENLARAMSLRWSEFDRARAVS